MEAVVETSLAETPGGSGTLLARELCSYIMGARGN